MFGNIGGQNQCTKNSNVNSPTSLVSAIIVTSATVSSYGLQLESSLYEIMGSKMSVQTGKAKGTHHTSERNNKS